MAAPMFALQPIPNPTFDIDFGKCLPHKSYTAAELQAWLNKIVNPFGASWIAGLSATATISVDGKGIKFIPTLANDRLDLFLAFKNKVNFIGYLKTYLDFGYIAAQYFGFQTETSNDTLFIQVGNNVLRLRQRVGGVPSTIYQRAGLVFPSGMHPVEIYWEVYTKMIKLWVVTNASTINTNSWQYASTTLISPTNKKIGIVLLSLLPVNTYSYIQKLQVKFTDGVFT